ncbi:MAG: histidine phosphatase family protein [Oscillospiraceae bacterium]|nr:histidine phosphatase family protein [Oscillospiraceae bacterium]
MRALLIRHGKTQGNSERRYIGITDEPLSDVGRAEVERVRPDSSLKLVYVSPLLRARQTASILFPQAEQRVIPDLRETDFGVFEGRSADEMFDDADYREWVDGMCLGPCPGGESRGDVTRRAVPAFIEAVHDAEAAGVEEAVFVTHGGVIMSILEELAVPKRDYYEYQLKNLCGWRAECTWDDDKLVLRDIRLI